MILRHAAALILCGWYLLLPPLLGSVGTPGAKVGDDTPFSMWKTITVYDTASACKDKYREYAWEVIDIAQQNLKKYGHVQLWDQQRIDQAEAARCIASDDPRLKGN